MAHTMSNTPSGYVRLTLVVPAEVRQALRIRSVDTGERMSEIAAAILAAAMPDEMERARAKRKPPPAPPPAPHPPLPPRRKPKP